MRCSCQFATCTHYWSLANAEPRFCSAGTTTCASVTPPLPVIDHLEPASPPHFAQVAAALQAGCSDRLYEDRSVRWGWSCRPGPRDMGYVHDLFLAGVVCHLPMLLQLHIDGVAAWPLTLVDSTYMCKHTPRLYRQTKVMKHVRIRERWRTHYHRV